MKIETIHLTPTEKRVLLLFDVNGQPHEDESVRAYLRAKGLEPKREYREQREDGEYLVYYFGHCYLQGHLRALGSMAEHKATKRA